MHYKAIDSCLVFLPMIHGKQLITVENLSETIDGLFRPPTLAAPHLVRLNLRRQIAIDDDFDVISG